MTKYAVLALLLTTTAHAGPVLPPSQFDHAFAGSLSVTESLSQDQLRTLCGLPSAKFILGCSHISSTHGLDAKSCMVFLATPDMVKRFQQTMDQLRRHEIAHCNGWLHPLDANSPEARADEKTSERRLKEETLKEWEQARKDAPWYRRATPMWPGAQ